jgi:hypothetical protein
MDTDTKTPRASTGPFSSRTTVAALIRCNTFTTRPKAISLLSEADQGVFQLRSLKELEVDFWYGT